MFALLRQFFALNEFWFVLPVFQLWSILRTSEAYDKSTLPCTCLAIQPGYISLEMPTWLQVFKIIDCIHGHGKGEIQLEEPFVDNVV